MFPKRKITAATLAVAMAATPTAFVMAQEADPTGETPMTQAPESSTAPAQSEAPDAATAPDQTAQSESAPETPVFEDEQIDAFASAVIEVTEIRDDYAQQLQGVQEETEQQKLIEEANAEMRSAIEDTDNLSMEDYMAINRAASMDEELNQKIAQKLEEKQAEQAG